MQKSSAKVTQFHLQIFQVPKPVNL